LISINILFNNVNPLKNAIGLSVGQKCSHRRRTQS